MRELASVSDIDPTDDSTVIISGKYGLAVFPNLRDHYCAEGHYCMYGATEMSPCPVGTYNSVRGRKTELECKRAEPGYYVSNIAASTPTGVCNPGHYCPEGSLSPT